MNTPVSMSPGSAPERSRIIELVEQLQASCSQNPKGSVRFYFLALCCGIGAYLQGYQFLLVYCGAIVVALTCQVDSAQINCKQIALLNEIVRELEKKQKS